MLGEAVSVMRHLWKGGWQSHCGKYFTVDRARIFTLPKEPPQIMMAASQTRAASMAGEIGDGLISFEPKAELVNAFEKNGSKKNPRLGQLTVCYERSDDEAASAVRKYWPNAGIGGDLMTDLELPSRFDEIVKLIKPETITEGMPLRSGEASLEHQGISGCCFDRVYVHQVGPDQDGFFRFYSDEIIPWLN